ncbi:MAG: TRAP transporter substrate-binding protein DctP [Candidatus Neomarinimicrobiota bacterium]
MKIIIILFFALNTLLSAGKIIIKMATLAPESSEWYGQLVKMGQEWKKATAGQVTLRIYPSGVVGDERDMIRKMRIGQIHAAAITSEGLSEINNDFTAFFMPMLYESWDDVDYIRERIAPDLENGLEENGFKLLYMADVGWVYWFTKEKITVPDELKKMKIFTWAGDYKTAELWKKVGFNPVPLASIDILSGLQTGLINALPGPPLYALGQQWFGITNHMLKMRWGLISAGIVIDMRTWNKIKPDHQHAILKITKAASQKIQAVNRDQEDNAIAVMQEYGLIVHEQSKADYDYWLKLTKSWYPNLRGSVVSEYIFDKVVKIKAEKDSLDQILLNQ